MDRFLYLIILFLISIYIYINFKTKYIINYFRLRLIRFRINFLLSCNLLYKNKIIYFWNSNCNFCNYFDFDLDSNFIEILDIFGDEACINYPYFSFFYIFSISFLRIDCNYDTW